MTEKRFTLVYQGEDAWEHEWSIKDNQEKGDWVIIQGNGKEIVEIMNNLHEENQTLKQTMKEVKDLLIEEVDVFSDKAIEHDVLAYKELQELDNKDAFYIADATKKAIKMLSFE